MGASYKPLVMTGMGQFAVAGRRDSCAPDRHQPVVLPAGGGVP
jgi:hypothetical protein